MSRHWDTDIARLLEVKRELQAVDTRKHYPLCLPKAPAPEAHLTEVERLLGVTLDARYRAFLSTADGWPHLYGKVALFGTQELLGSAALTYALRALDKLEVTGALQAAHVTRNQALPIAVALHDLDLFVLLLPGASTPGTVIWFAGEEIERYADFDAFFDAMVEVNQDIITMMHFSARLNLFQAHEHAGVLPSSPFPDARDLIE